MLNHLFVLVNNFVIRYLRLILDEEVAERLN